MSDKMNYTSVCLYKYAGFDSNLLKLSWSFLFLVRKQSNFKMCLIVMAIPKGSRSKSAYYITICMNNKSRRTVSQPLNSSNRTKCLTHKLSVFYLHVMWFFRDFNAIFFVYIGIILVFESVILATDSKFICSCYVIWRREHI